MDNRLRTMLLTVATFFVVWHLASTQPTYDGSQRDESSPDRDSPCSGIRSISNDIFSSMSLRETSAMELKAALSQLQGTRARLEEELADIKATVISSAVPTTQVSCSVHAQSYSATSTGQHHGFVELNGTRVWYGRWPTPNPRGINTMIIDPVSCTAKDIKRFDTWGSADVALDLVAYLQWIREGAVILGVTGDEPTRHLSQTLRTLKAAGVDVGDVQSRGNFVFVVQKGYPEKTVMVKSTSNAQPTSLLKVLVQGSSVNDLKFIRQ